MKALFVSYGGGHAEMCLPVIRALRTLAPGCDACFMALTTAFGVATRAGEAPLGYRDFVEFSQWPRVSEYGEQLLKGGTRHPAVALEESLAYLGVNFLEWVEECGEAQAHEKWQRFGRQAFLPVRFMIKVMERLRPDVVITTNSPRSEQAAVEAATRMGIPSLCMVDLFALPGDPFLRRLVHATRLTVLTEATRNNLIRAGVDAHRILVTGNPAFDALTLPESKALGLRWRKDLGWENLHVVLWAGHKEPVASNDDVQSGTQLPQAVQDRLQEWVHKQPDVALAIRYHPNEWHEFLKPTAHPRVHWSQPDCEELLGVLMGSDQVVVQGTTVGVQAYQAGKRVVSVSYSPMVIKSGMNYAGFGMAAGIDDISMLVPVLEAGRTSQAVRRVSMCAAPAAVQIAKIILDLKEKVGCI